MTDREIEATLARMFDSGAELLELAEREERVASQHMATMLEHLAGFVAKRHGVKQELVYFQVATAFRMSPVTARRRVDLAVALSSRLGLTFEAFKSGRIDEARARRIADATQPLTDEQAAEVEAVIADIAGELTIRQLNDRLRRAIMHIDPEGVARRSVTAHEARRVKHASLSDGGGVLKVRDDAERTRLAFDHLQVKARQIKADGDARTLDQIMTDVALDCLAGKSAERHAVSELPVTARKHHQKAGRPRWPRIVARERRPSDDRSEGEATSVPVGEADDWSGDRHEAA